jgi:hypothetical protein
MKYLFSHKLRVLALAMFGLGVVSASFAYWSNNSSQDAPQGFTLRSTMITTLKTTGIPMRTGELVRYQRSDGSFKQVTTYYRPDGTISKTDILFGQPNRGVFSVDEKMKAIEFVSGLNKKSIVLSETDLHVGHGNIVREEKVLGYRVLVARLGDDSSFRELYHAPALMGFQIKTVSVGPAGTLTIEPSKIVVGDPSDSDVTVPSTYLVAYNLYEEKIKTMEERGDSESAKQMREILRTAKSTTSP